MAEVYREPEITRENGLCFIQNGTYDSVSNNETWECIGPVLEMVKTTNDFYKLIENGCDNAEIDNLINEISTLTIQISKMLTKMKKSGGKIALPDAQHFSKKFEAINTALENVPYKVAKQKEKEFAKDLAEEFRNCTREAVAHNYITAKTLNEQGVAIEIPSDRLIEMEKILHKVNADKSKSGGKSRPWNGGPGSGKGIK